MLAILSLTNGCLGRVKQTSKPAEWGKKLYLPELALIVTLLMLAALGSSAVIPLPPGACYCLMGVGVGLFLLEARAVGRILERRVLPFSSQNRPSILTHLDSEIDPYPD